MLADAQTAARAWRARWHARDRLLRLTRKLLFFSATAAAAGAANRESRYLSTIRAQEALRFVRPIGLPVNVLPAQQARSILEPHWLEEPPPRMVARPIQESIAIAERNARHHQASVQEAAARARRAPTPGSAARD
jgi:hypothetical protein